MAKVSPIYTNFTAGECSRMMDGRVDFAKYQNACRVLENMFVWPQGPVSNRPGSKFISEVKTSAKATRLIPFEFSETQAYMLEFGDLYIRIYMNQGQVLSGGSPVEVTTTYTAAQLFEIKYVQSADVLFLCHPSHPPRKLSRTSHTAWTLSDIVFVDGPYLAENTSATTLTPSGTTGTITITASAATFNANHVGAFFRIKHSTTWGYAKVTVFTNDTLVTATVIHTFGGTTGSVTWREGAWSPYRGYPGVVTFFEGRQWFAATSHQPQTVWASKSGDYVQFYIGGETDTDADGTIETLVDADPLTFTIDTDTVNVIRWMSPGKILMIGTTSGEWRLSSSDSGPITPTNVIMKRESNFGSANIVGIQLSQSILFAQKAGKKIREIAYSWESDSYLAQEMTIMSTHITGTGLVDMAYIQEPLSMLWCVRVDGDICTMTYERTHQVVGWSRIVTDGNYESVATIPGTGRDEIWLIVNRTIGAATKRYVEVMEIYHPEETIAQEDLFYVDCGLTYDSAPATTISGLDHLEGKSVVALTDGSVHPARTVASGDITLGIASSVVQAGLPFTSTLEPMRIEAGAQDGTSQGKIKRIHELVIRFFNTLGVKAGPDANNLDIIPFRSAGDDMDSPPPLFSGDKIIPFNSGFDRDGFIQIVQDQPLPMTVLAIMPRMVTNER